MTVSELIAKLSDLPSDALIRLDYHEKIHSLYESELWSHGRIEKAWIISDNDDPDLEPFDLDDDEDDE